MSQQINLFNPIFLKQKKVFGAAHMLQTLAAVALGAAAIIAYGSYRNATVARQVVAAKALVAAREGRLAGVVRDFPPRQKNKDLDAEATRVRTELMALNEVESVLKHGGLEHGGGYAEYFRAFARQDVHGVWLTALVINGGGKDLSVRGRALRPDLVPGYISGLTREEALQGKTFGSMQIGPAALAPGGTAAASTAAPEPARFVEFSLMSQPVEVGK